MAAGGPALLGIASNFVNGMTNSFFNRVGMEDQAEINREQAEWLWKKFQSPEAQVRALSDVGMSPATVFGAGGHGQFATPQMSGSSHAPIMTQGVDIPQALVALAQKSNIDADTVLKGSQKSNVEADTGLKHVQARKTADEDTYQVMQNELLMQTFDEQVRAVALQNHWTEEKTAEVTQNIALLVGQCNTLQASIDKLRSEKELTDREIAWYDRYMSAKIEDIKSSAAYSRAVVGLTESQKILFDATLDDMKNITHANAQQIQKVVELLKSYGDAKEIIGLITQVVGSASDLVGSVASLKTPKVPTTYETKTESLGGETKVTHTKRSGYY